MGRHEELNPVLVQAVLGYLARANYQPVKPRQLAKRLGLTEDRYDELKRCVKRLVREGRLEFGEKHLLRLPTGQGAGKPPRSVEPTSRAENAVDDLAADEDAEGDAGAERGSVKARARQSGERPGDGRRKTLIGTFRRTRAGPGFVRPRSAGSNDRSGDWFVAPDDCLDAATGDLVLVEAVRGSGPRRNPTGRVIEVLERESRRFVGTYVERAGGAFVRIDGDVFSAPIPVGDPGARPAAAEDKVVIELVRYPSPHAPGEAVVVEVLGRRGAPGVDTLSIMREFDLPEAFPEEVLEAAREAAARFDEGNLAGRDDLAETLIVTIDPADARDFDDAISLERRADGSWRLGVHIADVTAFVQPETALDREARERATSVYLPDRVIPMLPELISNGLASLQPGRVRYARTAWLEFDAEGMRTSTTLRRSAIRSAHRFNYEDVDELLAEPERWKEKTPAGVVELVLRMRELAMLLRGRRRRRGALELVLSEVKVVLDARGRVEGARREINTVSHQIIEEFMLAANEAVAERLHERGRLFLRRIHDPPDPRRLELLGTFVAELGLATGDLRSRHELQALLERTIDRPEAPAVHYAVLRSMSQAVYSPAQGGHYALASECYCHFTSPIRRYPDLTVHRLVDELIEGIKPGQDEAALVALGEHCSLREREAAEAERELVKLKLLHHFGSRLGETFTARITGVEEFGVFVQGLDLPIDGLVPVEGLPDDVYWFDRHTHTLAGRRAVNRFRLGDALVVAVARVDLERRKLECRWAGRVVDPTSTDPGTTAEAGEGSDAAGAASPRTLESEAGANRHSRRKRAFGGTTARAGRGKSKRPHGPTGPRGGGGAGGGRGKRRKKR